MQAVARTSLSVRFAIHQFAAILFVRLLLVAHVPPTATTSRTALSTSPAAIRPARTPFDLWPQPSIGMGRSATLCVRRLTLSAVGRASGSESPGVAASVEMSKYS